MTAVRVALRRDRQLHYCDGVTVPTLMAQLRRDFLIHCEKDGQEIFDSLASGVKEPLWIDESNQRFCAYNHFGQYPARLIEWFDRHMNGGASNKVKALEAA